MRASPPSCVPSAPRTKYPTESTMRTLAEAWSGSCTVAAPSEGTNLGWVVMMVLPEPLWGSSSTIRSRLGPGGTSGSTSCCIKLLINVLFPARTGPTTPI